MQTQMRVENILPIAEERLITVQADALLTEAAKLLMDTHRALLVVCEPDGAIAGVITKTDIVRRVAQCQGNLIEARVANVMTQDVTSCRRGDLLHDVLRVMKARGFVHIPIVDQRFHPSGVLERRPS